MDIDRAEIATLRAAGVGLLERVLRDRTRPALVVPAVAAGGALLGAVVADGGARVAAVVAAVALGGVVGVLAGSRSIVILLLRRVAGGRSYRQVAPILSRHLAEVRRAGTDIPTELPGVFDLVRMVRRPDEVAEQATGLGRVLTDVVPAMVDEVRGVLAAAG